MPRQQNRQISGEEEDGQERVAGAAIKRGRLKDIAARESAVAEKRGRLKQVGERLRAFFRRPGH